jgi:hypothetical protein
MNGPVQAEVPAVVISRELGDLIDKIKDAEKDLSGIRERMGRDGWHYLSRTKDAGQALIDAKKILKETRKESADKRTWKEWVVAETGLSHVTVSRYMNVAKRWEDRQKSFSTETFANLAIEDFQNYGARELNDEKKAEKATTKATVDAIKAKPTMKPFATLHRDKLLMALDTVLSVSPEARALVMDALGIKEDESD